MSGDNIKNNNVKTLKKAELIELLTEKDKQIFALHQKIEQMQISAGDLRNELEISKRDTDRIRYDYDVIENSTFWKMTRPARAVLDKVKEIDLPARPAYYAQMTGKVLRTLKDQGPAYTYRRIRNKLTEAPSYSRWMKEHMIPEEELELQRKSKFEKDITFSIVVPLFNTPEAFLREMIESVCNQTYGGWELCMADGSDDEHKDVGFICREYARSDGRIKYKKLEKNLGIAGNTNACLEMASGDYIALFDHDDILHPSALYEMMKVICAKDADVVYTDELVFISPNLNKIKTIHVTYSHHLAI